MDYYGDESGHFKGVLQGDCEVCVIAIVAGDRIDCARCPKRAVRDIDDISEAKWADLFDVQKRRLLECFVECNSLEFGYSLFTQQQLHSLENYHLLYQDITFPPAWDLALAGYAYGEILYEMGVPDDGRALFRFDRISSQKQSEKMVDHIRHFVPDVNIRYKGSRQSPGIQAADCLAGAVAEDHKSDTEWLSYVERTDITECSATSLIQ